MLYWIAVLFLIVAFCFGFSFLGPVGALFKPDSLLIICVIVIPLLLASGQFRYFVMGFKIAVGRVKKAPVDEIKKVIAALKLAVKMTLLAGFIGFIVGAITLLANLSTTQMIGSSCALAIMSILYALFFVCLLLPVQARAEAFLIDGIKAAEAGTTSAVDDERRQ